MPRGTRGQDKPYLIFIPIAYSVLRVGYGVLHIPCYVLGMEYCYLHIPCCVLRLEFSYLRLEYGVFQLHTPSTSLRG